MVSTVKSTPILKEPMSLTNHLLTGAVLAKFLPLPAAVPLAVASHFVLDALPHFGFKSFTETQRNFRLWKMFTLLDVFLAVVLAIWLVTAGHYQWFLVGLLAYAPDTAWIYRFIVQEKFGKRQPIKGNRLTQFHKNIQKYERVWGAGVELVYALCLIDFLS